MIDDVFDMYKRNFPNIVRGEKTVLEILGDKDNKFITKYINNLLVGVSVINRNTIYMLCVDDKYQNKGIGSELLEKSEDYILGNGYDEVVLGAGKNYIMPGAPLTQDNEHFFKKRGYNHSWEEIECVDMSLDMNDFNVEGHNLGDTIDGYTYRMANIDDLEGIKKCVADGYKEFVPYYDKNELYDENNDTRVLIATKDDEVCGTLIVTAETEGKGRGSVGATVTSHEHRGKGVAATMVKVGTKYLKNIGMKEGFLGYTYTGIVSMYGRSGYKICNKYFMGRKSLLFDKKKNLK